MTYLKMHVGDAIVTGAERHVDAFNMAEFSSGVAGIADNLTAPSITIRLYDMDGGNWNINASIDGYMEIDALRRYCELVLEMYDKGKLE